ncbi:hypothetical protein EV283_3517 [Sphingomonas sp. BK036]|uniref:hypothetical protein n=1 Tax=Sphingomonas sp. BK036 TaxID=2512122 RepID=UPI00102A532B|nr:hypothetical protein [Sphingomonas sp. BK036]RZT46205.1 hypothetical protein EV283_3517 [Sphingomonas sp. BK036]
MIALELAAALLGMAAAPQYIQPDRYSATVRPAPRAKTDQRQTRKRAPIAGCGKTDKGYDARTGTYRDARGKRQHCPR